VNGAASTKVQQTKTMVAGEDITIIIGEGNESDEEEAKKQEGLLQDDDDDDDMMMNPAEDNLLVRRALHLLAIVPSQASLVKAFLGKWMTITPRFLQLPALLNEMAHLRCLDDNTVFKDLLQVTIIILIPGSGYFFHLVHNSFTVLQLEYLCLSILLGPIEEHVWCTVAVVRTTQFYFCFAFVNLLGLGFQFLPVCLLYCLI
jgi:hypothetical protein